MTQQNEGRYRQSPWIGAHDGSVFILWIPNFEILCVYLFIIFGDFASYLLVWFCLLDW